MIELHAYNERPAEKVNVKTNILKMDDDAFQQNVYGIVLAEV